MIVNQFRQWSEDKEKRFSFEGKRLFLGWMLSTLKIGAYNNSLIDYVDNLHEEIEDNAQREERKELLSLIGNCSVVFDIDEEDEDENIE